jgi:hypothetical protein
VNDFVAIRGAVGETTTDSIVGEAGARRSRIQVTAPHRR